MTDKPISQAKRKHLKATAIGGVIILVLAMLAFLFKSRQTLSPAPETDKVIELARTMCFGPCPVYKVSLYADGTVIYIGEDFVGKQGTWMSAIDQREVQQLLKEAEQIAYFSFKDEYEERNFTDAPYAITEVTLGSQTKRISHYYGDSSVPPELTEFEGNIDQIVNSKQWISPCSIRYPDNCVRESFPWVLATISWFLLLILPLVLIIIVALTVGKKYLFIVAFNRALLVTILLGLFAIWTTITACDDGFREIDTPVCHVLHQSYYYVNGYEIHGYLIYSLLLLLSALVFVSIGTARKHNTNDKQKIEAL